MMKRDDTIFDRAREVFARPLSRLERLDGLLKEWASWVRRYKGAVQAGSGSAGMSSGGINCWDDVEGRVDAMRFDAVAAAVDGLDKAQRGAIDRQYFPSAESQQPEQVLLYKAYSKLIMSLDRRGVVV